MSDENMRFLLKLADSKEELRDAQNLRYRVFVEELGGDGPLVDHAAKLERDRFDEYCDHLLLIDQSQQSEIVGVYRLMRDDQARKAGQYYSEDEYDLTPLKSSGRRVLELGRSCLDARYRGGVAMYHLWSALAGYVSDHNIEILFGVASFHGRDPAPISQALSLLHHRHLAPNSLRVRAKSKHYQKLDLISADDLDRRAAILQMPALIKAYLRLGGYVGDGAYVDHAFNTIDVCLIMDTAQLSERHKSIYLKETTR